ncbi:MAG: S8/S53 family peptidase [Saprospirales bacterium]|nr:S8/S53 family peptidase [Saprospirales bacterium]
MKFKIISPLDIRTEPSFASGASMGMLQPGFILEVIDEVAGDMWLGKNLWYRDANGFYYWSGAMEAYGAEIIREGQTVFPDTSFPEWMRDLRIPEIWKTYTGKSVGVAVIDNGIDLDNKDLPFHLIFLWICTRSLQDNDGHGTHCAGLIGARNRNGFPIGVAPDCRLFICKISEGKVLPKDDYERYLEAMEWCVRNNDIRIISISWASFIDDEGLIERMQQVVNAAMKR